MLGDGQGQTGNVGLLKGVPANCRAGHLTGDGNHRHRVHLRGGDSSGQVSGSRTGRCGADADFPGDSRVAVGSHCRCLLVTHQDMPQLGILGKCAVEWQDRSPGQPKNDLDSLFQETFADYLSPGQFPG